MNEPLPDAPNDLLVLMKPGLARINQEWHYHLANAAGRPRCGALLNLREWQLRAVAEPPADLCARCARLLNPKAKSRRVIVRQTDPPPSTQMGLPLDDDDPLDEG